MNYIFMINNQLNENRYEAYSIGEYMMATNKLHEIQKFNCVNCHKLFQIKYDDNNIPISLWCDTCRSTETKIKQQFKEDMKKHKGDPYIALAQMKVLLERSERYWKNEFKVANVTNSESILSEIEDILSEAKIPPKYLIAESLD